MESDFGLEMGGEFSRFSEQGISVLRRIFPALDWYLSTENQASQEAIIKLAQTYQELNELKGCLTPDDFERECRRNIDLEELLVVMPMIIGKKPERESEITKRKQVSRAVLSDYKTRFKEDTNGEGLLKAIATDFNYSLRQSSLSKMLQIGAGNCQAFSQISLMALREVWPNLKLYLEVICPRDGVGESHQRVLIEHPERPGLCFTFDPTSRELKWVREPKLTDPPEFVLLEAFLEGKGWLSGQGHGASKITNEHFLISRGYTYSDSCPTEEEIMAYLGSLPRPTPRPSVGIVAQHREKFRRTGEVICFMMAISGLVDTVMTVLPSEPQVLNSELVEPDHRKANFIMDDSEGLLENEGVGGLEEASLSKADIEKKAKEIALEILDSAHESTEDFRRRRDESMPFFFQQAISIVSYYQNKQDSEEIEDMKTKIDEVPLESIVEVWAKKEKDLKNLRESQVLKLAVIALNVSAPLMWTTLLAFLYLSKRRRERLPLV